MSGEESSQLDAATQSAVVFLVMLSLKLCGWAIAAFILSFIVCVAGVYGIYLVVTWTDLHVTIATGLGGIVYKVVTYTPAHLIN